MKKDKDAWPELVEGKDEGNEAMYWVGEGLNEGNGVMY
jgi:hypothetical protein